MALSSEDLDSLVKPGLEREWENAKEEWFLRKDHYAHDLREPGVCFLTVCVFLYITGSLLFTKNFM